MPRPIRQMYSFVINRLWRRRRGTFVFCCCCYKVISLIFWPHVATSKKTEEPQQQPHYIRLNPQQTIDIYPLFFIQFNWRPPGLNTHWVHLWRNDAGYNLDGVFLLFNAGWLHLHLVKIRPMVMTTKKSWTVFPIVHIVWKLLKMSHLNFGIFHQFFVLLKLTCLVALFDRNLRFSKTR